MACIAFTGQLLHCYFEVSRSLHSRRKLSGWSVTPTSRTEATHTEWQILVSHRYSSFSWWWAHGCPKHVQKRNKYFKQNFAPSWTYLQKSKHIFHIKQDPVPHKSFLLCYPMPTYYFYVPLCRHITFPHFKNQVNYSKAFCVLFSYVVLQRNLRKIYYADGFRTSN